MQLKDYPAHIRVSPTGEYKTQTVSEHLRNVSEKCKKILGRVGLSGVGELTGLLHDMGKFTEEFSNYIYDASEGKNVVRGSVNHTFAGVRRILNDYHCKDISNVDDVYINITSEIIALAIGSHHGQFDCINEKAENGFDHRLNTKIPYEEALNNFRKQCADDEEINLLFKKALSEIKEVHHLLLKDEVKIGYSFLYRLILSALIEADRGDTAYFMADINTDDILHADDLWGKHLEILESKIEEFPKDNPINIARYKISCKAGEFSNFPSGLYRMNIPTGGGKTLSSLRAALAHASVHNKKRIIFAIPLLSVLEQNAQVIRDAICDDSIILEHHSNVIHDREENDKLNENELITENWHSPIVITTLVQLLNALFSGKTSCIRRMHAFIDSVIVIDEVQSVPKKMLSLFNKAVNFLTEVCNCTVILCSATQPCFNKAGHGMNEAKDIIPYDKELWNVFQRTELVNETSTPMTISELADFAIEQRDINGNVLVVCNKKYEAYDLYNILNSEGVCAIHLSTSMCMEHRISAMNEIKSKLKAKIPFVCVSTQLMEAGVDVSFACTIRVLAGLDNHIQTAGRCNRNGEKGKGYSYCVYLKCEDLSHLPEIKDAQNAMLNLLSVYNEKKFGSLDSEKSIEYFYSKLYGSAKNNAFDFFVEKYKITIYEMLTSNKEFAKQADSTAYLFNQAFKTAGNEFEVFDSLTKDIIVPYGKGADLIAEFQSGKAISDLAYRKELLEKSKSFSVSIYEWQEKELLHKNAIFPVCNGSAWALSEDYYSDTVGVTKEKIFNFMEI